MKAGERKGLVGACNYNSVFFPVFLVTHTKPATLTPAIAIVASRTLIFITSLETFFLSLQAKPKHNGGLCIKEGMDVISRTFTVLNSDCQRLGIVF